MINKEHKYRTELFELLKENLAEIVDTNEALDLLQDIFTSDVEDINNEEIIKKITSL
tara:strand:+ start:1402 stop:1572 length:171 start_codon:yes stop_codon:yes gene_type:complete